MKSLHDRHGGADVINAPTESRMVRVRQRSHQRLAATASGGCARARSVPDTPRNNGHSQLLTVHPDVGRPWQREAAGEPETTLKADGHAPIVGAKDGSHSLQTSPDSPRPASGTCSGERLSTRIL